MRILLVEDDQGLSQALKSALAAHSIALDVAADLGAARWALSDADYRAPILDWQLPDGEGVSLIPLARRVQPGGAGRHRNPRDARFGLSAAGGGRGGRRRLTRWKPRPHRGAHAASRLLKTSDSATTR